MKKNGKKKMCINPIEYCCWCCCCWYCFNSLLHSSVFVFVFIRIFLSLGHCIMHFVCLSNISWIFNFWLGATIIVSLYSLNDLCLKCFTHTHTRTHFWSEKRRENRISRGREKESLRQQCQQWTISLSFFTSSSRLNSVFGPFWLNFIFLKRKDCCSIFICADKRKRNREKDNMQF